MEQKILMIKKVSPVPSKDIQTLPTPQKWCNFHERCAMC